MHTIPRPLTAMPGSMAVPQTAPKVRRNLPGMIGFFSLCALCMANINFITRAMAGTEQVFSILYLAAAVVTLLAFGGKTSKALGSHGRLWLAAIVVFLVVSTRLGMGLDKAYFFSPRSNFYRLLASQLIIVAAAVGARHMMLTGRLQFMLRVLFGFTVFAATTIILTQQFPWILKFVGSGSQGRSAGFFGDANRAGHAVCVAAAFGFACVIGESNRFKPFVLAGLVALVPCLFLTYSRSAIVFMAVLMGLQFFISPIIRKKGSLIAVLLLAICIPMAVNKVLTRRASVVDAKGQADLEKQQERMRSLFKIVTLQASDEDLGHRFNVAAVGIDYFVQNPVVGAGFRKLVIMPEIGLGCHNTFLRIFGEAGLFVGLFFVAAVANIALVGMRCDVPQVKCLVVGFIAMMSCAMMVSHSTLTDRLLNVGLGVSIGLLSTALTMSRARSRQQPAWQPSIATSAPLRPVPTRPAV